MSKPIRNPEAFDTAHAAEAKKHAKRLDRVIARITGYIASNQCILYAPNEHAAINELHQNGVLGSMGRDSVRRRKHKLSHTFLIQEAMQRGVQSNRLLRYDDHETGSIILSVPTESPTEDTPIEQHPLDPYDELSDVSTPLYRHLSTQRLTRIELEFY